MTTQAHNPPRGPAQSPSLLQAAQRAAADIKLAHSVFALPFALLGLVIARDPDETPRVTAAKLALVVACMVFARTWAMLFNRLADRTLDAANPRTAQRAFASGAVSANRGWAFAALAAALFWIAAAAFWPLFGNPWPALLAPPVLAWIAFYSLTKRFTFLCHAVLGSALALSPLSAAIAVDPGALAPGPGNPDLVTLACVAAMVLVWVAGFDVIYALQDMDHDRAARLNSIPARLGWRGAITVSRALHALAVLALAIPFFTDPRCSIIYAAAVALLAALLIVEHLILARRGRAGLQAAFFTVNGIAGVAFATLAAADILIN